MPDPFDFYLSSPAVWDGKVYFGSGDGNVYALDADTGTLAWKFKTGDVVHASPAIVDGTLFIGSWDSYFYALDARTGKTKWRFKTGEDPDIAQPGRHPIVGRDCRRRRLLRLPRLEPVRARREDGREEVGVQQQGLVGDRHADREGRQALLHHLGLRHVLRCRRQDRQPDFLAEVHSGRCSRRRRLRATRCISARTKGSSWPSIWRRRSWRGRFRPTVPCRTVAKYTKPDGTPNYNVAYADEFYDNMIIGVDRMQSVGRDPVVAGRGRRRGVFR